MSLGACFQRGSGRKLFSPRNRLVSKEKVKRRRKRWEDEHRKLYIAADVHASLKKVQSVYWFSTDAASPIMNKLIVIIRSKNQA